MGCSISQEGSKELPDDAYCKSSEKPQKNGSAGISDQYFSQHQKRLLRETWKIISDDQQNHGIMLFLRIFHRKPETKKLFPFGHLSNEDLLQNAIFRSHAKRFMHAVDTTVQNLDALEVALIPVLLRLGEKHVIIEGFKEEYLDLFMGSILDVFSEVLGKRCTNEVRDAWGHLANFIADKMQEGYQNVHKDVPNANKDVHNANKDIFNAQKDDPNDRNAHKDVSDDDKDVHNADKDVHNADKDVHNADKDVHNADKDVHKFENDTANAQTDVPGATKNVPMDHNDVPNANNGAIDRPVSKLSNGHSVPQATDHDAKLSDANNDAPVSDTAVEIDVI